LDLNNQADAKSIEVRAIGCGFLAQRTLTRMLERGLASALDVSQTQLGILLFAYEKKRCPLTLKALGQNDGPTGRSWRFLPVMTGSCRPKSGH